jgi:hypothetical protein
VGHAAASQFTERRLNPHGRGASSSGKSLFPQLRALTRLYDIADDLRDEV